MESTEAWEIRGLKIFCVLSAICAAMNLLMRLPELDTVPALVALLWVVASTVWLAGAVFVIWSHNRERYLVHLIIGDEIGEME